MEYTVSDFASDFRGSIKLLCGSGGLSRHIDSVGILDYELEPEVKNRYLRSNFHEGQLALSSLLYAKNNPYLVSEAVKHLCSKKASALVIRNVFHLPIPESLQRYADSRNFSVFLIEADDLYFEDVIYHIRRRLEEQQSQEHARSTLDTLLRTEDEAEIRRLARSLSPSLKTQHQVVCLSAGSDAEERYANFEKRFRQSLLRRAGCFTLLYRERILLFLSWETTPPERRELETLLRDESGVGISAVHYDLAELRQAVEESRWAAQLAEQRGSMQYFEALGVRRFLLSCCHRPELKHYCNSIVGKLQEYDAENNAQLLDTLLVFTDNGGRFTETAQALGQHENTVRYRLERIHAITGLDWRRGEELEELSMAAKLWDCLCLREENGI